MRFFTFFICCLMGSGIHAQFKNIILDKEVEGERPPVEPSVAISLKDKDNIVVGAILDKVYVTTDGGLSWNASQLSSLYGVYGDPVVISDKKGDFHYFHLSDPTGENWQSEEILDRIICQTSKDGGQTWSEGASIGFNHPKDQDKEWAIADPNKGNLYVSWTQFDTYGSKDPSCKSDILFSESSNGKKWSDPLKVNNISGDCKDGDQTTEGAMPAVGPDGQLFVAWAYDGKIFLDRSLDKGKTWLTNDIEIADQAGGWALDIPGLDRSNGMPILICDNSPSRLQGALYLNWSDQRNGSDDTDIWFQRSLNYGDTWSTPVRVNDDEPGKHQFLSWMAVDNTTGIIYILYYDRRAYDNLSTDVYLAYSLNGGTTFVNKKISETPFVPDSAKFFGDYTNLAAHDGRIVPVWTRMDGGKASIVTAIIDQEVLIPEFRSEPKKKKKNK